MTRYGTCKNCGSPMVKAVYKKQSRKEHPWGLTTWGSTLVCSRAHESLTGALECHFARPAVRESIAKAILEPSPFMKLFDRSEGFQGATITIPLIYGRPK